MILQNSEPIKIAVYSLPLWIITIVSLYLYVGAVSRQVSAEALSFRSEAPDLALLLAVEGSRLRESVESKGTLLQVLQVNPAVERFLSIPTETRTFAYDHAGKTLAVGGNDGCVYFFEAVSGRLIAHVCLPVRAYISSLAFNANDGTLLISDGGGRLYVWDIAQQRFRGSPILAHNFEGDEPTLVVPLSDGHTVLSSGGDSTLKIWALTDELRLSRSVALPIDPGVACG